MAARTASIPGFGEEPQANAADGEWAGQLDMSKARSRKVITIETHQQTLIRSRRKTSVAWCAACGTDVSMVSVDRAARATCVREMEIYKLVEAHALHFNEDAEGRVLICLNSLRR